MAEKRKIVYTDAKAAAKQALSDQDSGAIKVPEGMSFMTVKKPGKYVFDILPFFHNPDLNKYAPEDATVWWETTYWRHTGVGPEEKTFVCLKKTFGKPCYCCEMHAVARKSLRPGATDDEKKAVKSMEAKQRQLMCVLDRDERKPELQLFEMSFHLFGKHLLNKIDAAPERMGYGKFWHLTGGMTLSVKFVEGANWVEAGAMELFARDKDIPEDILEDVPCLDDCLIEVPYAKMKATFDGTEDGQTKEEELPRRRGRAADNGDDEVKPRRKTQEEEEDKPVARRSKKADPEPEPEKPASRSRKADPEEEENPAARKGIEKGCYVLYTDEDGKKLRCQVIKVSGDGTSLTLEDEEGGIIKAVDPKECKLGVPVEEEEESPKKGKRKPKAEEPDPDEDEGWSKRKK